MFAPRETIVRDALKLSEGERAKVVQELLDSLSPEVGEVLDDSWAEELDRRFASRDTANVSSFASVNGTRHRNFSWPEQTFVSPKPCNRVLRLAVGTFSRRLRGFLAEPCR